MKGIKTNNKGFSLVELIIVIAIMAILVAVLAPQYLKYVDRSRFASDVTTIDGVYSAVQIAVADPQNSITEGVIKWENGSCTLPTADSALDKALKESYGTTNYAAAKFKLTSKYYTGKTVTITVNSNGTVSLGGDYIATYTDGTTPTT